MKLGTFVEAQALRHPDRVAVVCDGRRVTYRALDEFANRLANALRARGLRCGDRMALYLGNSVAVVEAFLGVIKAGGVAVPVSTRLTPSEIRFMLEDCRPRAVVFAPESRSAVAAIAESLPETLRIVVGEAAAGEIGLDALAAEGDSAPPPPLPEGFDDCMICYTSGTTGAPKGAIATHANMVVAHLVNAVEWGITAEDRYLVTTPLAHRTGLGRLANALCLGGTLVVMPKFEPAAAVDLIERERISVAGMVPTVARLLLPEIERDPARCASLRVVLVTGEAFPVEVKRRLLALLPQLRLYAFFASTETGGVTSLGPAEHFTHPASAGRPTPGMEVRLVDESGAAVATGEVGEILVRAGEPGRFVTMRGYYNRPEANAAAIRDGWIATGDLGRFDAEGYLYVVDRKKDMILSGGLNIYSKEVEQALLAHPAVQDAAVIGVPDAIYGEAVAAFVERRPGCALDAAGLVAHCRSLIASYKKPKFVHFVDALPRNGTGKVMKFELRELAARLGDAAIPAGNSPG